MDETLMNMIIDDAVEDIRARLHLPKTEAFRVAVKVPVRRAVLRTLKNTAGKRDRAA